jgi:hypothetical protein
MASPAQITANRANAQKSTGPRSSEGKAASRFNALKHGIDAQSVVLPGEDPAAYDALAQSYYASLQPLTPEERFHVDTMIRADWQKRRLERVETDLYRALLAEFPNANLATAILADSPTGRVLHRVQRQLAAFERSWFRAQTAFHRGRARGEAAEEASIDLYLRAVPATHSLLPELASFQPKPAAAPQPPYAAPTNCIPPAPAAVLGIRNEQ